MTPQDSRQIEYLRVFSILAMMWVHVSPGIATPSIVSGGQFALVGLFLGDTLGRISVSLLSFVSGYLFWTRARSLPFLTVAWRRFESILLPCLVWSAIYLILAASKITFTGTVASVFTRTDTSPMDALNAWAGITGPTANLSLFFIRDLFVSTLILRSLVPVLDRAPYPLIAAALLMGVLEDRLQPLIFRDSILQFVLLGAGMARLGVSLAALSRPVIGIVGGNLLILAGYGLAEGMPAQGTLYPYLSLLLRRVGVCLLILSLSATLMNARGGNARPRLGRATFLAFLLHMPLIGILWVLWQRFVGNEMDPSYLAFYLFTPFLALLAGYLLDSLLDAAPPTMQLALRGKVRVSRRRPD
mgnify:CR=1 FL=1